MNSIVTALLLFFLIFVTGPQAPFAQVGPPTTSSIEIDSECVVPIVRLTVEITISATMNPDVVGFDVTRREFGRCTDPVSVVDTPLARGQVGVHNWILEDMPEIEGFLYEYEVVPIDDEGERVADLDPAGAEVSPLVYASCGVEYPLMGHGTLEWSDLGPGLFVPCANVCGEEFLFVTNFSRECGELIGSGIEVLFYGFFASFEPAGTYFWSTNCVPMACAAVPTTGTSWGTLKRRY